MRKLFLLFTLFLLLLVVVPAAMAAISGTKHDLSASTADGQLCVVCHTPHHGVTGIAAPLWNHALTTATFTMYSSTTLDASMPADGPMPDGVSKLCLSCHDGVTGILDYGDSTGNPPMSDDPLVDGNPVLGTDLSNDHPVSFTYDTNLATTLDGELYDPATTPAVAALLFGGNVECASCHDVHDNTNAPFLRMSNSGSSLCLTCHAK